MHHRHRERGVGAGLDVEPLRGVHRRRRELRRDGHHLGAVVLRFPEEMRIGDAGHRRVRHPHQHALRLVHRGHGVAEVGDAGRHVEAGRQVADAGVELGHRDAGDVREAGERGVRGHLDRELRAAAQGDGVGAMLDRDLDELLGDLARRLIPGDALPLAFAALADPLHRVEHALLAVHVARVAQTLVAAARTVVGRVGGAGAFVLGLLLLAPHDAVPDVDVEGAGAGAVGAVGAVRDLVPGPLAAPDVLDAAIGAGGGVGGGAAMPQRERGRCARQRRPTQETPSRQ